jgi:hypothetical protein
VEGNIDVSSNQIKHYYGFPRPNYDSGWVSIDTGELLTLTHGLGGNVDNYVVDMQFKGTEEFGIHNAGIGGLHVGFPKGVHWMKLTTSSLEVWRHPTDDYTEQVRIRIWVYD